MITYRLWDSSQTFVDIAVNGWLENALIESGMLRPHRAQFFDALTRQWLDVMPHAVTAASQRVQHQQGAIAA